MDAELSRLSKLSSLVNSSCQLQSSKRYWGLV